jgi:hypothetical protein
VVAHIELVHINGIDFSLPVYSHETIFNKLKQRLESIRSGVAEDVYGWNAIV